MEGFTCCVDDLSSGPSGPLEERIDYVFLPPANQDHSRAVSCEQVLNQPFRVDSDWQWASDHVGLLTAIALAQ